MPVSNFLAYRIFLGLAFPNSLDKIGLMQELGLKSASAVIEALGGNQAVAELTASNAKAVSNWRGSNSFPAWTYISIKGGLDRLGKVAPDELWSMKPPQPKRRTKVRA